MLEPFQNLIFQPGKTPLQRVQRGNRPIFLRTRGNRCEFEFRCLSLTILPNDHRFLSGPGLAILPRPVSQQESTSA
jgi:hypothetical protein